MLKIFSVCVEICRVRTFGLLAAALIACSSVQAADAPPEYAPPQQVAYQDCVTHTCRVVPEVKQIKKTVYEVEEVPFCVKRLPPLWSLFCRCDDGCEPCAECQPPRYRKVLVKKEIVCKEICTSKCVVEEHVSRVPCPVCQPVCR
jgi:hypothetical protein